MESSNCPACRQESTTVLDYCSNCNFPYKGTENERSAHIGRFISEKNILSDSETSIKKSRNILLIIAALNFVMFFIAIFSSEYLLVDAIVNLVIAVIFAMFAFFIKKSPVIFTVIPLLFIVMLYLIDATYDPSSIARGMIFKMFILGSLGYGAYKCYQAEKFKKKYNL
ncbi:hypothetical protein [Christiangramia sp. SM2212]|uniref:Zinc ribbon domain-containing protein n=1 Tax=Christiangramia sediminicola TaxID=3073267 RepID=A0ABU1EQC6_9FLAO|nr:hypothetical protein [Christiangramia sp. SM2212]MDR5590363.1 hypothetical protein [Christiangramia sp. SM2212]